MDMISIVTQVIGHILIIREQENGKCQISENQQILCLFRNINHIQSCLLLSKENMINKKKSPWKFSMDISEKLNVQMYL